MGLDKEYSLKIGFGARLVCLYSFHMPAIAHVRNFKANGIIYLKTDDIVLDVSVRRVSVLVIVVSHRILTLQIHLVCH